MSKYSPAPDAAARAVVPTENTDSLSRAAHEPPPGPVTAFKFKREGALGWLSH